MQLELKKNILQRFNSIGLLSSTQYMKVVDRNQETYSLQVDFLSARKTFVVELELKQKYLNALVVEFCEI